MSRILIGVDVCKEFLDAYARPAGSQRRFLNTPEGIEQLVAWAQSLTPQRVVLESTGPYQKAAVGALLAAGLPAVVVNARQVRDFAKGTGQLAKTDTLDAAILAHFAEVVATTVRPLPPPEIQHFRDLCDRRSQLVRMLATEKNHRHAARTAAPRVLKNIDQHIATCSGRSRISKNAWTAWSPIRKPSRPRTRSCNRSSALARRCRGRCWSTCRSWAKPAAGPSPRWWA